MGLLKLPKKKPIRYLADPVWFANIYTPSGKKIKKFMTEKEAKKYSLRTGESIYINIRR